MAGLDSIADISVFTRIVAAGSLSAAARELGQSLATVSKCLIRLEATVGTRLVNRTTRHFSLTAEGHIFHSHCLIVLEEVKRAEDALATHRKSISGLVRVTASSAFARRQIAPRLGLFLERHPDVRLEIVATDEIVDIVKSGIDVAIRQQADLPSSNLVSRVIATDRRVLCASPDYVDRYGAPQQPEDLGRHRCITFGDPPILTWNFCRYGQKKSVEIDWAVHVNTGDAAFAAALGGSGIVAKSMWEVAEEINAGRLVELLADWRSPSRPIHVIYPSVRYKAPRVAAFVDFIATELKAAERQLGL